MPKRIFSFLVALGLVATAVIAPERGNAQEPKYELLIGYRLPDNPDLADQARAAESNFLERRAVALQACSRGTNKRQCEHQAEQAFREGLASIQGLRFGLYVHRGDNQNTWLLDLTDAEAVNPDLDQYFGHLEPGSTHIYPVGVHVDTDSCELIRDSDNSEVSIYEGELVNTICNLVKNNQNVTQVLNKAVKAGHVWEVNFLLKRGAGTDATAFRGDPAVDDIGNPFVKNLIGNPFWNYSPCLALDKPLKSFIISPAALPAAFPIKANARTQSFALFSAATIGDVNLLRAMMNDGVNLNGVTKDGATTLMYAAAANKSDAVTFLLDQGADIEARDSLGATAVIAAAIGGATDAIKVLHQHGGSLSTIDNYGRGALEWASCGGGTTTVAYLLSHGADVNARDKYGWTPMMAAAAAGRNDVVRLFLQHKADVRTSSKDGVTALLAAALADHPSTVDLLLDHGADIGRRYECKKELCRPWLEGNWPAIVWAVQERHFDVAKVLSAHGANINTAYYKWFTPLGYAAYNPVLTIGLLGSLLKFGADPNAKDLQKETPLHYAAAYDHEDAAEELLNHGADINAASGDGWTALMDAAQGGYTDIVNLLVGRGAKLDARYHNGATALMIAAGYPTLEIVKVLVDHGAEVNAANDYGYTPLMEAAGNAKVEKFLLDHGAAVNARENVQGWTALHFAIFNFSLYSQDQSLDGISVLLDYGADINAKSSKPNSSKKYENHAINEPDSAGTTPLMIAAYDGELDVVKLLLKRGADANIRNSQGKTALDIAKEMGKNDTVSVIETHLGQQ